MLKGKFSYTPPAALTGSLRDYRRPRGAALVARVEGFAKWRSLRRQHELWPFGGAAENGLAPGEALDFARPDALGLARHPAVLTAAREAVDALAPGRAAALEGRIAAFLAAPAAGLFPTAWLANYAAVKALARAADHVVLDALAPDSLKEAAQAATRNVCLFRHQRLDECRGWLEKIRGRDAEAGVLVVAESLSETDEAAADLKALQALCHEFDATLLVHAGRDFGATGPGGAGVLGEQDLLGKVDVVTGGLGGAFAADGGFVVCRSAEMTEYVRACSRGLVPGAALAPAQVAAALAAFDIVEAAEGEALRMKLADNVANLRSRLAEAGLDLLGAPAPVVGVVLGAEGLARLAARQLAQAGVAAELVEFPAAPKDRARLALHISARHAPEAVQTAARAVVAACAAAREEFDWLNSEREKLRANG